MTENTTPPEPDRLLRWRPDPDKLKNCAWLIKELGLALSEGRAYRLSESRIEHVNSLTPESD